MRLRLDRGDVGAGSCGFGGSLPIRIIGSPYMMADQFHRRRSMIVAKMVMQAG
jgi:hypothetical protein